MNVEIIENKHIHGKNLCAYASKQQGQAQATFAGVVSAYERYRRIIDSVSNLDEDSIRITVNALNEYRKSALPVFDKLNNAGQKALGYTIMEEYFYLLFQKKIAQMAIQLDNLFIGKGNSYVSLSFAPRSFSDVFEEPSPYIHTKDQDFMLGVNVEVSVKSNQKQTSESTVIPVVAIECKTYLERNMLDSCAATASRLKNAMPYCIYIVAAEYMKMSDASPELTDIDEVYILCRAKNTERERRKKNNEEPLDIDAELVIDLYLRVCRHLNSIWWKPEDAVELGKVINRPI